MAKYETIYKSILKKIEENEYKIDEKLPSENELMKQYNTSRDTIRKALNLLVQNGIIQKSKGRGSIVLDHNRFEFPISGVVSFKEISDTLGHNTETKVIFIEKTHPDLKMQKILNLKKTDYIWIVQRIRQVEKEAIILDTDFINANIVKELTKEIAEDSLYQYFENELNLKIASATKNITCQKANGLDYRLLDLAEYDMIVNIESITYLEDARILHFTSSHHRPDKFRFKEFARRIKKI